ncbi:MAG: hypothetical protein H0W62_15240 [Chitinophagales bacterium]|nr:hypothetical protein [Chitinophagales bacterium]
MKKTILSFLFQFFAFQVTYSQVWAPLRTGLRAEDSDGIVTVNTISVDTINGLLYAGGLFGH